jgi:hypothetical protein
LALRAAGELLPGRFGNAVLGISVVLQVGGVLAFVAVIWPRIYLPGAKPGEHM